MQKAGMTLGSLFDGIGGWQIAAVRAGIKPLWSSEIAPFPAAVTAKHFPDTKQLGDITKLDGTTLPPVDIVCAGSPCQGLSLAGKRKGLDDERSGLFIKSVDIFKQMRETAGGESPRFFVWENVCFSGETLITTSDGYKKISEIKVADLVKTKSGSYHRVKDVIVSKDKQTINLLCCGALPILVTANHPFWVRTNRHTQPRRFSHPYWKKSGELTSDDWVGYRVDGFGEKTIGKPFAYAVGRWLADGSIVTRDSKKYNGKHGGQKKRIFISTSYKKYDSLKRELLKLPYHICENKMKQAVNFTFTSDDFAELISECGRGARFKKVPAWIFSLVREEQEEVLRGYLSGDGHLRRGNECSFASASLNLACGIARLVRNVYHTGCSISLHEPIKNANVSGRTVNSHEFYNCNFSIPINHIKQSSGSFFDNGFVWCRVKSVKEGDVRDVYNLSVETDNTYEANGICVHNCGAYSCNEGRDFQAVLSEIGQTDVPMPRNGKWAPAGLARLPKCDIAWRTLDAQFWGVPQRRRCIFLIADFAEKNRCAAEVLFVEQSVPGDTAESRTAREEVAAVAGDGAQASSWCIAGNVINRKDKNGGHHLGVDENVSFTLNTIDRHAVFAEGDAYCLQGSMIGRKEKNGPQGSGVNKNVSFTLNTIDRHAVFSEDEKTYSVQAIGHIVESEKSSTLAARDYKSPRNFVEYQKEVPLYDISHLSDGVREIPKGAVNTLAARMGTGGGNVAVLNEADRQETDDKMTVRRLTVTECERLQGLPDGYTDVSLNGKPASESERLKAIGNGMAQPCADFVLRQIALTLKDQEQKRDE